MNKLPNMVELVHGGEQYFMRVGGCWHVVDSVTLDHTECRGSTIRLDVTFAVRRGGETFFPVTGAVMRWLTS